MTVSMTTDADWRTVHEQATKLIEASEPVAAGVTAAATASTASPGVDAPASNLSGVDQELLDRINAVLDDRVRPALAGDGGGLEILGLIDKTLQIRYQGACGTCPSSIAGTLMAIQNLLQTEIDEELTVVPA